MKPLKQAARRRAAVTSLDGRETITLAEFDRRFDRGDDVSRFLDPASARRGDAGDRPWLGAAHRAVAAATAKPRKQPVALRLDADLVDWFRAQGPGYQTRINAILRAYRDAAT